jgi:hypothetical protein
MQARPKASDGKEGIMRKTKVSIIAALALASIPAGAMAAHPSTPASTNANSKANATSTTGTSSKASPKAAEAKVMFVLRGQLTAYTAAVGTTNGSVSIMVKSANHKGAALKNTTVSFPVSSSTKLAGTITVGHNGIVKVRAAKSSSAAALQLLTAFQVIDQGASS